MRPDIPNLYRRLYDRYLKITNSNIANDVCYFAMTNSAKKQQRNEAVYNIFPDMLNYKEYVCFDELYKDYILYISAPGKITHEKCVIRFGLIEGNKRWKQYCERQAYSNSLEYKKKKYGWTDEQYAEYNKNRAVTLSNLIKRHGEEAGKEKWKKYVDKQRYAGCAKEYFIEKYGEIDGIVYYENLNKKKVLSLENFIKKYGEIDGIRRWESLLEIQKTNRETPASNIANSFFDDLYVRLPIDIKAKVYYDKLNKEYFFSSKHIKGIYYVDFYDITSNKIIEFNGDYFHCNPTIYNENYYNKTINAYAKDIWQKDKERKENIQKYFGCNILEIWEKDVKQNKEEQINKCLQFLGYEYTN